MVIDRYPPEYSGAGRQLASLAPYLTALGNGVTVVTGALSDSESSEGDVRVVRLRVPDGPGRDAAFSQGVRRWLRANRRTFDIVHAHGVSRATMQALIAAAVMRKPTVLKFTMAGGDDPAAIAASRFGKQKILLLRRIVRAFIAPSAAIAGNCRMYKLAEERIHPIPNGVDTHRFAPLDREERLARRAALRRECGWAEDGPLAVFVGSVEPRKGVDALPEVWRRVIARSPEARLVLVGPTLPGQEAYAGAVAEAFGVTGDAVRFTGADDRPERWLQGADVFVFPSRAEGLPNALIEAQACGVPAAAAALPGVTESVIEDGATGSIVSIDEADAMADAIGALLADDARRDAMGSAAAARARDRFALPAVAARYDALYQALLRRTPAESAG